VKHILVTLVTITLGLFAVQTPAAEKVKETDWQVLFVTDGEFEEVKENVELAITGQGLVIDGVATVGTMLERTKEDLGFTKHIYGAGDVFEFCSASLSRKMMEADPTNLVFCPYTIQVYNVPDEPGKVYVGYRRPNLVGDDASKAALKEVDDLLAAIVKEAIAWE